MARIEWVHERLHRWAIWKTARSGRQGGFPKSNVIARWWQPPNNREPEAHVPIDDAEAWATDKAVQALDDVHRRTLECFYLETASTTAVAKTLCAPISTIKARIATAHRKLREALDENVRAGRAPALPSFMRKN